MVLVSENCKLKQKKETGQTISLQIKIIRKRFEALAHVVSLGGQILSDEVQLPMRYQVVQNKSVPKKIKVIRLAFLVSLTNEFQRFL